MSSRSVLGMTTRGDQILDRALSAVGGKGLFIKELEVALLEGAPHLAVHSLKDVPMELAPEFRLAAVMAREDPRDCLVSAALRHAGRAAGRCARWAPPACGGRADAARCATRS
jgi:hydroxymethylbilane synthase